MKKLSDKSIEFIKILGHMILQVSCILLLMNILVGIIEPIPDIIPIIGNLDEIAEVYLLWWSWPRMVKAIQEFKHHNRVDDDKHVDNVEYFDVKAEVLDTDSSGSDTKKTPVTDND